METLIQMSLIIIWCYESCHHFPPWGKGGRFKPGDGSGGLSDSFGGVEVFVCVPAGAPASLSNNVNSLVTLMSHRWPVRPLFWTALRRMTAWEHRTVMLEQNIKQSSQNLSSWRKDRLSVRNIAQLAISLSSAVLEELLLVPLSPEK